jgi:hypothetical protein
MDVHTIEVSATTTLQLVAWNKELANPSSSMFKYEAYTRFDATAGPNDLPVIVTESPPDVDKVIMPADALN